MKSIHGTEDVELLVVAALIALGYLVGTVAFLVNLA